MNKPARTQQIQAVEHLLLQAESLAKYITPTTTNNDNHSCVLSDRLYAKMDTEPNGLLFGKLPGQKKGLEVSATLSLALSVSFPPSLLPSAFALAIISFSHSCYISRSFASTTLLEFCMSTCASKLAFVH